MIHPILLATPTTTTDNNQINTDNNPNQMATTAIATKKLRSPFFTCNLPNQLYENLLNASLHYEKEYIETTTTTREGGKANIEDGDHARSTRQRLTLRVEEHQKAYENDFRNGKYCELDIIKVLNDPNWYKIIQELLI